MNFVAMVKPFKLLNRALGWTLPLFVKRDIIFSAKKNTNFMLGLTYSESVVGDTLAASLH